MRNELGYSDISYGTPLKAAENETSMSFLAFGLAALYSLLRTESLTG
jgi:hypothetical protein